MNKPDVFYPVIEAADDNIELRYSLRSLENTPHGDVYIIGHKPLWVQNVVHIPFVDKKTVGSNSQINIARKEVIMCECSTSEDIIVMSDDVFILEKGDVDFSVCGRTLKEVRDWAIKSKRPPYVIKCIDNALEYFPDGIGAYHHGPKRANREKLYKVHKKYPTREKPFLLLYLYVNEYDHDYRVLENYKVYNDPKKIPHYIGKPYFSTGDAIAKHKEFKPQMDKLFPNISHYERI